MIITQSLHQLINVSYLKTSNNCPDRPVKKSSSAIKSLDTYVKVLPVAFHFFSLKEIKVYTQKIDYFQLGLFFSTFFLALLYIVHGVYSPIYG